MARDNGRDQERAKALLISGVYNALCSDIAADDVRDIVEQLIVEDLIRRNGIREREALLEQYEQGPLRRAA